MICGLLAWFDEEPGWLYESVFSAALLCDHVLAVDGAYALYPDARPQSDSEQADAIVCAAEDRGVGCTVHRPAHVWVDQLGKRSLMFALGRTLGADWFFVFDADDVVRHVPADAHARLERTSEDVAVYTLGGERYHRGLFRSLAGLRVEDAHYHYLAERGGETVHLRGNPDVHELVPFLDLTDLKVEHRKSERDPERLAASARYRRLVAEHGLEKTTPEHWAALAPNP